EELIRPIVPEDWNRPLYYAARVKSLTNRGVPSVCAQIVEALGLSVPKDWVFPNLRTLVWTPSEYEGEPPTIQPFLTPGLKHISLSGMCYNLQLSLFSSLMRRCPGLTHITICVEGIEDTMCPSGPAISCFIRSLRSVEALSLEIPDLPSLEHLARLPMLRSLKLSNLPSFLSDLDLSVLVGPFFSGLLDLSISATEPQLVICMLEYLHQSSIAHLSLSLSLQTPDDRPDIHFIRHLFALRNLESLHLNSPGGFNLHDTDVDEMGHQWPQLQSLRLIAPQLSSPITLLSLQTLARHCPRLHHVALAFNVHQIPAPPIDRLVHTNLLTLEVDAAIDSRARLRPIAKFLAQLFPNLRNISVFPASEVDSSISWRVIEALLEELGGTLSV
ncbi:hypothetical protein GGX14DRAFT_479512, partial [Mycena pura]